MLAANAMPRFEADPIALTFWRHIRVSWLTFAAV
jgi:hypothetical protein